MKLVIFLLAIFDVVFAAEKIYEVTKSENCKGDQPILAFMEAKNGTKIPDKVYFSGYLEVREKVLGPLEFSFDSNRCDMSMKKCEKFTAFKAPGVCDVFNMKNGIFADVVKNFQPHISCPLKPGKYVAKDSILDVSTFSAFPSEGFLWVVTVKAISGEGKNKKLAMCVQIETKITKMREKKKKN